MSFSISDGINRQPVSLHTTAQVRNMDRYAIDDLGVDGYELMTRAASASLASLREMYPDARSLAVVCGAGNNAGDGYVVARLAMDLGWQVNVMALSSPAKLKGDAGQSWRDFVSHGGHTQHFDTDLLDTSDLIVDAMLGTGLTRCVEGEFADAIRGINASATPVVSLDIPSGLNGDTGQPQPLAVHAALTTTFIAQKIGLYTGRAAEFCGRIVCHLLGLPSAVVEQHAPVADLLSDEDARRCLPRRVRQAHKGTHGRVLIVGGHVGMSGAVVLAGVAALRSGAGTVTVACHPRNRAIVAGHQPELMCAGIEAPDQLDTLIASSDVIALGPGLGRDDWSQQLFARAARSGLPTVIDADGLRCLAMDAATSSSGAWVLTPHVGEASALIGLPTKEIANDRRQAAIDIAKRYKSVVVLKGAHSVVAHAGETYGICARGNPGMATAGSGDVLTGIAAGIWAQQPDREQCAVEVARAAVFVHAVAGDRAAVDGERGMLASDITAQLRACVNPE